MKKSILKKAAVLLLVMSVLMIAFAGCSQDTAGSGGAMSRFKAEVIGKDDVFTEKNIAEYDLTVVNIWATWCGYCIVEMPDLQNLYEKLPENVNFVSVCIDGDTQYDTAKAILEANKCTFTAIIPDEALNESLISLAQVLPTTFFVDSNGNLVGEAHMGLPAAINGDMSEGYMKLVEERLAMLK
ncbi:MAG: TlpA family protein disulfide reductase [Oscillospiraceae bacterium]|nr:TlpA family protein disulfide reductase [Oscillospiraceae bacterium]